MDTVSSSFGPALTHFGLLLLLLGRGLWSLRHDWRAAVCALFLLAWTDLVCTALLLATIGRLGDRLAYVALSIVLAIVVAIALRIFPVVLPRSEERASEAQRKDTAFDRLACGLFALAILAVVVPTALLCIGYDPDNFDSVAYRLPRAFLYMGQGTLRHITGDFRMQYYPFDMTLAYLATAIHGLGGHWLNLFGFVTWLVGGVAVDRTARAYGAGRTAALFAATIYITTPAVLISASSTNDDMIAGVPLLIGFLFATLWWRSAKGTDAALAAMGLGLSAGSKLHYPFLMPVAGLFCFVQVCRLFASREFFSFLRQRWIQMASAICIMAVLALPALVINVFETGRATPDLPNYLNKPLSLVAAGTTSVVTTANLLLSPIPDLDLDPDQARRQTLYKTFNSWMNSHLFAWVKPKLNYSNEPYYRFEGVASSDAYLGAWEQSVWLGFVPWLLLAVPAFAWSKRVTRGHPQEDRMRAAAVWLVAAFFGWHFTRCLILKYVGGAGIYYSYAVCLAAPAVAWLWDAARPGSNGLRIGLRAACLLVLITNLVGAANTFAYNPQRNLPELFQAKDFRPRQEVIGKKLTAALQASHHTLIAYTQWELPVLDLISANPQARYAVTNDLPRNAAPGYDLSFMIQRDRAEYSEIPLQFLNDDRQRWAMIGSMSSVYGTQHAFGHGEAPETKPTDVIADYQAETNEGNLDLGSGWSTNERTHRWSDGPQSSIDFDLPDGKAACHIDLKAITLGPQHITATLNDQSVGSLTLESWFPGKDVSLPLPDMALMPGRVNHLVLTFDNAHKTQGDGRQMSLGLIKAALICSNRAAANVASRKTPDDYATGAPRLLSKQGYAILSISEARDAGGGLTGIKLGTIYGTDADESFNASLSLVSPAGVRVPVGSTKRGPWSQVFSIPGAPRTGSLGIEMQRVDRPDIVADVDVPIAPGTSLGLHLRPPTRKPKE